MDDLIALRDGGKAITITLTSDHSQYPVNTEGPQAHSPTPSQKLKIATVSQVPVLSLLPTEPAKRSFLNSCIIVLTVTSLMIVNVANSTSMYIILPTVQKEMNLEPAQLQWAVSAYPLSSGCLFLVCGRLADLYGRKKMFLIGSLFLSMLTLACGFSNDIITLNILRGIQGMGAAAGIPASLGILAHAFPPSRARSLAFATFAAGVPTGAVFGLAIGGVLTEFTAKTWRSPFYLLSGLSFLCFLGGLISADVDLPSTEVDKRIDWIGGFLVTTALVFIVFVLSQGELASRGWATPYIIVLLILAIILIGLFLSWQDYLERIHRDPKKLCSAFTPPPLMKLSIWSRANGRIAAMMMIAFTNWCAFMSWYFWIMLYFQDYMNYTAMETVIRLLPMFVWGIVCNLTVGLLANHISLVWIIGGGTAATTTACLLFAIIDPKTTYWAYAFVAATISVMGPDLVYTAGMLFIAKFALPHEQSVAGALLNTMIQLGTAVGITVTTVVSNSVGSRILPGEDTLPMYRAAQWTSFAFGIIATTLSILFFRGVGVVGHRSPNPSSKSENEEEKDVNLEVDLHADMTQTTEGSSGQKENEKIVV